jgi:hypothetical protein
MRTRTVPLFVATTGTRIDPAEAERVAAEARRALKDNRQAGALSVPVVLGQCVQRHRFGWSCLSFDLIAAENVV